MEKINKEYKDRLINFIFGREENKEWTLSLYNAVNGSDYKDASIIRFNTLKDVLFLGMRNDTSFMIADVMSVYEHQSTFNPNMPLRMLQYVGDLYAGYITENKFNKFGKTLIKLPTPKLVVFYNGEDETDDEVILELRDSFEKETQEKADVNVRVRMLNVNYGKSTELLDACKPLAEYAWFINEIRKHQKSGININRAVDISITEMPEDYMIRDFLVIHRQEVQGMLDTEYNETEVMELFKEDGRREGANKHLVAQVCKKLAKGRDVDTIAYEVEESVDMVKGICSVAKDFAPAYDPEKVYDAYVNSDK